MVIGRALREGIVRVWEAKILALVLFLFKAFFALLLVIPAYHMFSRTFSFSPFAENFLKGYDFYPLVDFFSLWSKGIDVYLIIFFFIGLVSILGYIFLSGGLWGFLFQNLREGKERFTGEKFFGVCGRYFWSFFKIFMLICLAYMASFMFGMMILSLIKVIIGKELSFTGHVLFLFTVVIIFLVLFMWVDMWGDYLRICRVSSGERKLRTIITPTLRFIFRNFGKTLLLYYLLSIVLGVGFVIYLGISRILHFIPADKLVILSLFILQQVYGFFRSFYRLVYYSSQLALFDKLTKQSS